jgi:uncharacterized protein (DUF305 family)
VKTTQRALATSGALVLAFALTACSDDTATPASEAAPTASSPAESAQTTEEHNDTDVTFAQGMIVHHRGAIAMADLAQERAQNPEVQALAERISTAQGPEIDTMVSWLEAWGEDVPRGMSMEGMSSGGGGSAGGGHGMTDAGSAHPARDMDMEASMTELDAVPAAEFDRAFLEMMTEHHQGAVQMAQTEQADGQNPEALELAATIEVDQTREIEEMRQLLQSL